jgi:transcriptional regulator with XRE-family HTH domain
MTSTLMTVGECLFMARTRRNESLRQVALHTGVSVSTISRAERGKELSWSALVALGLHYGLDFNELARIESSTWD